MRFGIFWYNRVMAKVTGPLFSLDVRGTIAKTMTFGANKYSNWVRGIVKRKYTRNPAQDLVRTWFKAGIDAFKAMRPEERWLWDTALTNYKEYGSAMSKNLHRMGRCLFLHDVLSGRVFEWEGSPFPPELWQMLADDEIDGYDQINSDVETLTGLAFCDPVKSYYFRYLGKVKSVGHPGFGGEVAGFCTSTGSAIALDQNYYEGLIPYKRTELIAHELTHAVMDQHGWNYNAAVAASEQIANECSVRVADGWLVPPYLYEGKALPELVDNPEC